MKTFGKLFLIALLYAFLLLSCSKSDPDPDPPPAPPTTSLNPVNLLQPLNNTQCLGSKLSSEKIRVDFDWSDVVGISSYLLEYEDMSTGVSNSGTFSQSFASLELEPGTPYKWKVTISDTSGNSETSTEFSFYTEGLSELNHVPFPADIDFFDNGDGTGTLFWEGFDLDNDIDFFQIFLDTSEPPAELVPSTNEIFITVTITMGITYFIKVRTYDLNGNFSDSKKQYNF